MAVNWAEINAKLPTGDDEKAERSKMFKAFDNGNGYLSLAEVDKAIRDVLKIDDIFDSKPAIMRAFQAAKKRYESKSSKGEHYIERIEFKFFLVSLRQYFEYYQAFNRVDSSGDKRINLQEFKTAQPNVEKWVGKFNAEAEFRKIDRNRGGYILFEEFCTWALDSQLDLEDDED